jgi:N-methylhydantoinase A
MALDTNRARAALLPIARALAASPRIGASGDEEPRETVDEEAIARAALGVVRIANAAMERAIRAISVERGHDPRDFTLVAFGGAGPLHAAYLAEALGMRRVLVPRFPGVLSALGMLAADVTRDASQALLLPLDAIEPGDLHRRMEDMAAAGLAALAADGEPPDRCRVEWALDLRYSGQSYEITTPLLEWEANAAGQNGLTAADLAAAGARFHTLHERRYGHAMPARPIEAVLLRMRAVSTRPALAFDVEETPRDGSLAPRATISAALAGDSAAPAPAALYERADLRPGDRFDGPAVVVQLDATTVVPPGWRVGVDRHAQLVLTRQDVAVLSNV